MKGLFGLAMILALAVPAAFAQKPTAAEQELFTLERNWSQAAVTRDAVALPSFYADEYIFTNSDGEVSTRTEEIANITTGMFKLRSFRYDDMKVRFYGNVAIVTGKNTIAGFWDDVKKDVSGPYRFTDVFVKRNGQWRCVVSQSSRVVEKLTP
jgi:ketosteroid isomerase-like protein